MYRKSMRVRGGFGWKSLQTRLCIQMDASRVLRRIALMLIPGLADHFPADYQQAIDASLLPAKSPAKRPVRRNGKRRANHNSEILVTTR